VKAICSGSRLREIVPVRRLSPVSFYEVRLVVYKWLSNAVNALSRGSDEKLTAIVQVIKRPFRSGRPLLAFELGVLLVHVPANTVEDVVVLLTEA
jgi:hypothetical protein